MRISPDQSELTDDQRAWLDQARRNAVADILVMTTAAAAGHPGGSLSTLDALLVAYGLLKVDPAEPLSPNRDRVFISHGHISPGTYSTLAAYGFIEREPMRATFRSYGSIYGGHVETCVPGVEWNTGNLGQGLSAGVGSALAARLQQRSFRSVVFMGDGEQQKGQISEARRTAVKFGLGSLIALLDVNRLQIGGNTADIMPQDIAADWAADGWKVIEVPDGHDHDALFAAFKQALAGADGEQPTVLVMQTVMGKGFSPIEDQAKYHGQAVTPEMCRQALAALDLPDLLAPALEQRAAFESGSRHHGHDMPTVPPPELDTGEPITLGAGEISDCRSAYGRAMEDLANRNNDGRLFKIAAFSCDLEGSVKLSGFRKVSPNSFFECGIQEHSTAVTAGRLSREGHSVFFSTFGVFCVTETFNQQRLNDFNRAHLKVVATHCGLDVGMDGPTHQCIDYVGLLRSTPGWEIYVAADANQTDRIVRALAARPGCQFLGMGRSKLAVLSNTAGEPVYSGNTTFVPGKADLLHDGEDAAIIACGGPVHSALEAARRLAAERGIGVQVWNAASLRPFDADMVRTAARTGIILTAEDHRSETGLGGLVALSLVEQGLSARLHRVGVDHFAASGDPKDLYRAYDLDADGLERRVTAALGKG